MNATIARTLGVLVTAAVLASTPLWAQAPDCTGISDVLNTDPELTGELAVVRVATGLNSPVHVTAAPGDLERLYIVEQDGLIRVLKDGAVQAAPFLDIDLVVNSGSNERGLLGLAFHPDFDLTTNFYFFVYYTASTQHPTANNGDIVVERYEAIDADDADESSAELVINIAHSISNHNGGTVAFSPVDGRLYLGTGDGGSSCDPGPGLGNAQNLNSLLGKMLRLDVSLLPYKTGGNPFAGGGGLPEIWAYGLRNPYQFTFDRISGAMYIGDVGQFVLEEVNCVPGSSSGGENYGWLPFEGTQCPNPSCGEIDAGDCAIGPHTGPVREYSLAGSPCAIIGGYVYHGCRMSALEGTYFYADACDSGGAVSVLASFRTDATCSASADRDRRTDLQPTGNPISDITCFGEDNQGELYMCDRNGDIWKIVPDITIMQVSGPNAPQLLADELKRFFWENLENRSDVEIDAYKVYRATAFDPQDGPDPFTCIKRRTGANWATNDGNPLSGQVYYYVVTAAQGLIESTAGVKSDGSLRVVDTGSVCPP